MEALNLRLALRSTLSKAGESGVPPPSSLLPNSRDVSFIHQESAAIPYHPYLANSHALIAHEIA
jgi:hypothetical protein